MHSENVLLDSLFLHQISYKPFRIDDENIGKLKDAQFYQDCKDIENQQILVGDQVLFVNRELTHLAAYHSYLVLDLQKTNTKYEVRIKRQFAINKNKEKELINALKAENEFGKNTKKQGALIFRNDYIPNDEFLESDNGYNLMTISAGINEDSTVNIDQFKKLCKYVLDAQGIDGTTAEVMGNYTQIHKKMGTLFDSDSDEYIYELEERNHSTIQQLFSYGKLANQLSKYEEKLKTDHFPHIWERLSEKTKVILAMAECLYSGLSECKTADYAPICLEYCRALEVEINELIFSPFKSNFNVSRLAQRNYFYDKLMESREMTLGECVFLLDKCTHQSHPLIELRRMITNDIKQSSKLLNESVAVLRTLNTTVRRLSAHTTVMTYEDLISTRQQVLGIGNLNVFYVLRDAR